MVSGHHWEDQERCNHVIKHFQNEGLLPLLLKNLNSYISLPGLIAKGYCPPLAVTLSPNLK